MAGPNYGSSVYSFPVRAGSRDMVYLYAEVDIGATGAPTLDANESNAGISITRNTTGIYDLVYPDSAGVRIQAEVLPTGTADLAQVVIKAKAATAGTAQLHHVNGSGTVADPANGDKLLIHIWLETRRS